MSLARSSFTWKDSRRRPCGPTVHSDCLPRLSSPLIAATSMFEFAIVVATPDDTVTSRNRTIQAPRDNVIFELGLFFGTLGQKHTFLVYCDGDQLKLPSDLAGITAATYKKRSDGNLRAALGPTSTALRTAMSAAPRRTAAGTLPLLGVLRNRLAQSHQERKVVQQLESLPNLAALNVWPENAQDIEKIADLLVQFEDKGWAKGRSLYSLANTLHVPCRSTSYMALLRLLTREKSIDVSKMWMHFFR